MTGFSWYESQERKRKKTMKPKSFSNRVTDMNKAQLCYLAGAYENLARRHYRKNWRRYFDIMITKAEEEAGK